MIDCPICKRSFEQGVFNEIHNMNDLCRRVFINKRLPFDTQAQRVDSNEELQAVLLKAKSSLNFAQRNPLNSEWKTKRQLFKRYSQMHQARLAGSRVKIDKIRLPVVADPDNPD